MIIGNEPMPKMRRNSSGAFRKNFDKLWLERRIAVVGYAYDFNGMYWYFEFDDGERITFP
jgi:hypothetical protein